MTNNEPSALASNPGGGWVGLDLLGCREAQRIDEFTRKALLSASEEKVIKTATRGRDGREIPVDLAYYS